MRSFTASLSLLVALMNPAVASEWSPHKTHKKAAHAPLPAAERSDLLPMPEMRLPDRDVVREPSGGDKSLHLGNVTVTPGGFLDVGTGGGGRD